MSRNASPVRSRRESLPDRTGGTRRGDHARGCPRARAPARGSGDLSRRLLLRALFASKGHRTAEELSDEVQAEAPDIHISTIYRNLDELERLGIVVHSHFGHGPATYHLATAVHGHFVCEECGKLIEVPDTFFDGLAREARTQFGFTIDPHHFAMLGRCTDCA